jgi:hypothetical protein
MSGKRRKSERAAPPTVELPDPDRPVTGDDVTGAVAFQCAKCKTIVADSYAFIRADAEAKTVTVGYGWGEHFSKHGLFFFFFFFFCFSWLWISVLHGSQLFLCHENMQY